MANTLIDGRACSVCQVHKPARDFPRSRQTKTGLHPQCKACRAAKRMADPDRKAKDRATYERNRERILLGDTAESVGAAVRYLRGEV